MKTTATHFYLHPEGDDALDGRARTTGRKGTGPWRTLPGARDNLRKLRAAGQVSGQVRVELVGGTYPVGAPLDLGVEDSQTTFCAAGRGAAFIDGGEALDGFTETTVHGRRAWVLDLPDVAAGKWNFRSLFVNGKRRPRARYPKFSADAEGVKNVLRIGEIRFPEKRGLFDGDNVFKPKPGDLKDWPSLPDAEIVILHYWIETRMGSPRLDEKTGWITCARQSVFNLYESFKPGNLARYYIDNLFDALTDPGEWYLDKSSGRLTYLPLPSERLGKTHVVAPRTTAFVRVNGTAFNQDMTTGDPFGGKPVRGLRFEGLTFRHGDWFQPQAKFIKHNRLRNGDVPIGSAVQGAVHVPATIEFRHARDCSVDSCTVELAGFTAVEFGPDCRDCALTRSTLRDLGASGVMVGGADLDGHASEHTGHITVSDNTITDIGRVFHQAIGVLITNAFGCHVVHNEIARTCYTGISCGWSWGYRETISRNNRIENNFIHDIGQGVLSDMGGIYLLGVQPGTVVRGNHIHSVNSADYGGWGIYPDEGSSHLLIEHNWVHDTQGSCFSIHFARELVVRDNVFARSRQEPLVGVGKGEKHISANLHSNALLGPAPGLISGGYGGDLRTALRSDANLIWFPDGRVPACTNPDFREDVPHRISFAQWKQVGNDRLSVVADPREIETATNLVFPKKSAVWKTGFRPHDWSDCGPRKGIHTHPALPK